MLWHGVLHSMPCSTCSSANLGVPAVVSHFVFPTPLSVCHLQPFQILFHRGAITLADGLSCVLRCVRCEAGWNGLEPGVWNVAGPSCCYKGHPCSSSATKTLPRTPKIYIHLHHRKLRILLLINDFFPWFMSYDSESLNAISELLKTKISVLKLERMY